jgi:glycosyltransferase involved in cell wall biosynthesis
MERVASTVAHGLARRGHEVTVITTAHPDGPSTETDGDVQVEYLPGSTWRRYQRRWWDASYERLREAHTQRRYDVILSQSAGGLGYVGRAERELQLPSAVLLHGSARGELRTAWRNASSPRGLYRLGRLGWRLPPQVIRWRRTARAVGHWLAVSDEVASDNRREVGLPPDRTTVVPVGVDTDCFRPDPEARARVRAHLGIPSSAPVVVLVTRLEREKGVHLALAAARRLRAHHPELRLLIAGRGHHERRLRQRADDLGLGGTCSFLGLVDHDRLPAVLAAADVFLLASLCAEGRPLSVVEASAAGLPVVATESGGTRGLVEHGITGLLIRRRDRAAMVDALDRLLADEPGRRAMGLRGRQAVVARSSEGVMLDVIERVLTDVSARRSPVAPRPSADGLAS